MCFSHHIDDDFQEMHDHLKTMHRAGVEAENLLRAHLARQMREVKNHNCFDAKQMNSANRNNIDSGCQFHS